MSDEIFNHFESRIVKQVQLMIKEQNPMDDLAEENVQEMHTLAFFLYRQQQYQEASHFFRLLVIARPSEAKYWKGLGACLQMLKNYEEALSYYIGSQILNREQPDPYLYVYAADCYFALKQKDAGLKALEAARLSAEKKKDLRILQHVVLMRELWSK